MTKKVFKWWWEATEKEICAYLAGFIDGEGSVHIARHANKNCKIGLELQLNVSITNTNKEILEWIKSRYGGYVIKCKKYKTHHKTKYQYKAASNKAKRLLEDCLPYLIEKKEQAEIAIYFCNRKTHQPKRNRYNPMPESEWTYRLYLKQEISDLNQRDRNV